MKMVTHNTLYWILTLGVIGMIYLSALLSLPPSVFWSPDEGAKFIQMHSLLTDAGIAHPIAYGAAAQDPLFTFYPTAPIYPQPLWPRGVLNHWSNLFPLVSLPFFQLFGLRGLYVVPLLCALLSVVAVSVLARKMEPGAATPGLLLAGLGTPLFFQSVLFLEHTLAGALGLGALLGGWAAVCTPPHRQSVYAVAMIACLIGLFILRDETVIFLAALTCTGLLLLGKGRTHTGLRAGLALLAFLILLAMVKALGDTLGDSNRASELIRNVTGAWAGLKDPVLWCALPTHLLHVFINDPLPFGVPLSQKWAVTGLAGLGLCALSQMTGPRWQFPGWLLGAVLVSIPSLLGLCMSDRYRAVHGLLLSTPCLVLAWLPLPAGHKPTASRERFLVTLLPVYLVIYALATWLFRRPSGGPEWGLRYALLAYLLAAAVGAVAVTRFQQTSRGWRRLAGLGLATLLVVMSCAYGVRGMIEVQVTKRDLQAFEQEIHEAHCPLITDQWWLASALAPAFVHTEFYTLNPHATPDLWLAHIANKTPAFLYVSYDTPPDPPKVPNGPKLILAQHRRIQGMIFSRYSVEKP
ncbi:MAG: hypothetical protein WCS52_10220 [bacterium]